MNDPKRQHIVRLVILLVAVGVIAGATVALVVSRALHGLRHQRVEAMASQESLRTRANEIGRLTDEAHRALELDANLESEAWSEPVLLLRDTLAAAVGESPDAELRAILEPMRQDAAESARLALRGSQWRQRYRKVLDDINDQRSLGRVRGALAQLRAQVMQVSGQRRLQMAVAVHQRFRRSAGRALEGQDAALIMQSLSLDQELAGMETDLAQLARLVEVLNAESAIDRFSDLLVNQFNPLLVSLGRADEQLAQTSDDWSSSDALVLQVAQALLGEEAVIDLQAQQVRAGAGGLLGLRIEAVTLAEEARQLHRQRDAIFDRLDRANSSLAALTQHKTLALAKAMEMQLSVVRRHIMIISVSAGVIFLSLALAVTRGIRGQVNAIQLHTAELTRQIAQRQAAENDLSRLKGLQDTILGTILEGILWINLQGRIVYENPAAARLLGWNPQELIGKPAHSLLHHSQADGSAYEREHCPMCKVLSDGKTRRVDTEVFWRQDGKAFPVEYTTLPVLDHRGIIEGVIVVFTDVT